ncbi:DUF6745 domain-containing protein [Actinoplanes sp. NPDC049548]|uniref:DUF6745 domain-containing protein n=1 Tax=Actinoplanes sp. NPDC049548 TaxID=3155152 RepID=UPI0034273F5C
MTAAVRRRDAAAVLLDHWHRADEGRREWLAAGVATGAADRETAEQILTRFYLRHGRARPRFAWVDSPAADLPHTAGIPSHEDLHAWLRPHPPAGRPPIAVDIAASWTRLRAALDEAAVHPDLQPVRPRRKGDKPWPVLPPVPALEAGVPLRLVLDQSVRQALRTALMHGVALPVRAALGPPATLPICWYGQQEAPWIAHHDVLRRLGLAQPAARDAAHLDEWAALARATGWWWPGEQVCVLVERPSRIGPVALADDPLAAPVRATVEYRDGTVFR